MQKHTVTNHMLLNVCESCTFQPNDLTQICQATLGLLQNRPCLPRWRKKILQALNNSHRNEACWELSRHVEDSLF